MWPKLASWFSQNSVDETEKRAGPSLRMVRRSVAPPCPLALGISMTPNAFAQSATAGSGSEQRSAVKFPCRLCARMQELLAAVRQQRANGPSDERRDMHQRSAQPRRFARIRLGPRRSAHLITSLAWRGGVGNPCYSPRPLQACRFTPLAGSPDTPS
jgi:hypothetical protein